MKADGRLTVTFSKSVILPNITLSASQDSPKRALGQQAYSIQDIVSLKVKDADEDESQDKTIKSFTLEKIDALSLELKVFFANPSAISADIKEPDSIVIEFTLPGFVIDSESFDELNED